MSIGPSMEAPVTLLKTCMPLLTSWTYCVAPTSPSVSGGAQLQATPGKGMPAKFRIGGGMTAGARVLCTTGSGTLLTVWRKPSGSGITCWGSSWTDGTGMSRSGGETSCLTS